MKVWRPSVSDRTYQRQSPGVGLRAASMLALPGDAMGVGGRPGSLRVL